MANGRMPAKNVGRITLVFSVPNQKDPHRQTFSGNAANQVYGIIRWFSTKKGVTLVTDHGNNVHELHIPAVAEYATNGQIAEAKKTLGDPFTTVVDHHLFEITGERDRRAHERL